MFFVVQGSNIGFCLGDLYFDLWVREREREVFFSPWDCFRGCVGRGNSPGKANLVLCARMAHQDDSLATQPCSGTPNVFFGANKSGWHSFGYFSVAID